MCASLLEELIIAGDERGEQKQYIAAIPKLCAAAYFKILFFLINLFVLFFQMATKMLGRIVTKLFGPNYVINGSVRYFPFGLGAP